jgi:flavin reductase
MSWIDQRPDDAMAGAFEAVAPEHPKTVEPVIFREAMARLGAAVHIVATAGPAGRAGVTATAVSSVSDQPPTLLVCLNRRSVVNAALRENRVFSVNTLGAEAEGLADIFAGRTGAGVDERFAATEWLNLSTGSPVLKSAVIAFDCRIVDVKAVATHNVYFAAVEAIHHGPPGSVLVYHERAYKKV